MAEQLPCDVNAELAVLATLLADPNQLAVVSDLVAEHFYAPESRHIFAAFVGCVKRDGTADAVTVRSELVASGRGGEVSITQLMRVVDAVPETINVRLHADTVLRHWRRREAVRIAQTLAGLARTAPSSDEAVAQAVEQLRNLQPTGRVGLQSGDSIRALFKEIVDSKDRKTIDTGFRKLDDTTNGIPRKSMLVLAAPTGGGKTAFSLNLLANFCRAGLSCRYVSLEMDPPQLNARLLCNIGNIHMGRYQAAVISKRASFTQDEWQKLTIAAQEVSKFQLEWCETKELSQLLTYARLQHRVRGLDVLIVDYLQRASHKPAKDEHSKVSAISAALKDFALETNTVVVAVAQFNRKPDTDKRNPTMADLRDSGQIERDADIVGLLYPDKNLGPQGVWLDVQKHRFSQVCKLPFRFDKEHQRFSELDLY